MRIYVQNPYNDKNLLLLNEIGARRDISQREISSKTGLSLGSVNLLIKKMIREGLIKMETIPTNRIVYMLTPAGFAEKATKTIKYIKKHYHLIQETKSIIMARLDEYHRKYEIIYCCWPGNELDDLLSSAVSEYLSKHPDRIVRLVTHAQARQLKHADATPDAVVLYFEGEASDAGPPGETAGVAWAKFFD
jgi:DNA-binding MarR family transcriptional regulator